VPNAGRSGFSSGASNASRRKAKTKAFEIRFELAFANRRNTTTSAECGSHELRQYSS